jgi:hypothetical protein
VLYWCRNRENTVRPNVMGRTVFHVPFTGTGDDVLRFFSGINVLTEPFPGLNLVYDG